MPPCHWTPWLRGIAPHSAALEGYDLPKLAWRLYLSAHPRCYGVECAQPDPLSILSDVLPHCSSNKLRCSRSSGSQLLCTSCSFSSLGGCVSTTAGSSSHVFGVSLPSLRPRAVRPYTDGFVSYNCACSEESHQSILPYCNHVYTPLCLPLGFVSNVLPCAVLCIEFCCIVCSRYVQQVCAAGMCSRYLCLTLSLFVFVHVVMRWCAKVGQCLYVGSWANVHFCLGRSHVYPCACVRRSISVCYCLYLHMTIMIQR